MSRTFVIEGTFFVLAAMLCGSWVEAFSIPANSLSLRSTSFLSRRAPVCSSSQRRKLASSWRALVDVSDADFKDLVLESEGAPLHTCFSLLASRSSFPVCLGLAFYRVD
eukprot:325279-Rhodomonas_salina.1